MSGSSTNTFITHLQRPTPHKYNQILRKMANGGSNSIHDPDNSCTKHKTASEKRTDYKISRIGKLKQEKDPGECPNANFLILFYEIHSFGCVYVTIIDWTD